MNEMHVCRSCGYVVGNAVDGGAITVCPSCTAATWMIVRSKAEFMRTFNGVPRRPLLKVFRKLNARALDTISLLLRPTAKTVH